MPTPWGCYVGYMSQCQAQNNHYPCMGLHCLLLTQCRGCPQVGTMKVRAGTPPCHLAGLQWPLTQLLKTAWAVFDPKPSVPKNTLNNIFY